MTEDGAVWDWDGRTYGGRADGRVRLADNADGRWGPDWAPDGGWANTVSGEGGEAVFAPDSSTRVAGLASGALLAVLLIVIVWGIRTPTRRKTAKPRTANQRQVGEESDAVDSRDVDDGTTPVGSRS